MVTLREAAMLGGGAVVIGTGVWLTSSGRPYGTPPLTVHKLIDLIAIVAIAFIVYRSLSANGPAIGTPVLVLAVVVAIVALATGGMASASQTVAAPVLWAHRVTGFLLPVLAGYLVFLVRAVA